MQSTNYDLVDDSSDESSGPCDKVKNPSRQGFGRNRRWGFVAKWGKTLYLATFLLGACLQLPLRFQRRCQLDQSKMCWFGITTATNWITQDVDHGRSDNTKSIALTIRNDENTNPGTSDWTPNVIFGNYSMPITFGFASSSCNAINRDSRARIQQMFDVALLECYGFAFFEARNTISKLLAESISLSSSANCGLDFYCPMCHWILSMGYSPYINHPIIAEQSQYENAAEAARIAYEQAHKKLRNRYYQTLSLKELGLIDAMYLRFRPSFTNQTIGFESYSKRLKVLHETIVLKEGKGDSDAMGFLADSIMILHSDNDGYHFYQDDDQQTPEPGIAYAISLLEDCLEESPDHPLCQHLYIHITEPSKNIPVRKAGVVADRLAIGSHATEAQHLQHMPSHTYLRIGRYHDAVASNVVAHESDEAYIRHGLVPYGPAHNTAFLVHSAQLSGERKTAYRYADLLRDHYRNDLTKPDGPGTEEGWHIWRTIRLRFGDYASILDDSDDIAANVSGSQEHLLRAGETEKPVWPYAIVLGHYSKGVASLWNNASGGNSIDSDDSERLSQAMHHLRSLRDVIPKVDPSFRGMVAVANLTLSAGIEYYRQSRTTIEPDTQSILQLFREARIEQEGWAYTEPPSWYTSVALCEGTLLRIMGRYTESIAAFRNHLKLVPENRFGLYGLRISLTVAGANVIDIQDATSRFNTASYWADADIQSSPPIVCPEIGE